MPSKFSRKPPTKTTTQERAERNAYRARMAAMRRDSLRGGLVSLANRRNRREARNAAKHEKSSRERLETFAAPPPEDERLTRMSQTREMTAPLKHSGPYMTDPNAAERRAAKVARYEAQRARKASETQEALHTLYMRARDFIVTEEQLDQEIDLAFGTAESPAHFKNRPSVWAHGPPPSLQSMLDATGQTGGGMLSEKDEQARVRLMEKRMKKVAEKLTGGKM
ncbi:MAG: hypothetical protein Q9159_005974 [Coniocarpon cinnabarinum]